MKLNKEKIKQIFIGIGKCLSILLLLVAIVAGVLWSNNVAAERVCQKMEITVHRVDTLAFLTPELVLSDIIKAGMDAKGVKVDEYNSYDLQKMLNNRDYIEEASCVFLSNNVLNVNVKQIIPVMRVFATDGSSSYYNAIGKRIDASLKFHVDVPLFVGVNLADTAAISDYIRLANYIIEHQELYGYVTAINVKDADNVIIVPNVRGHVINFGNISHGSFDNKFAKIKQIYKEVIPHSGWWMYDTISVKWKHQIVASRRNYRKAPLPDFSSDEEDEAPDIASITIGE